VIVDNFYLVRVAISPHKTDSPLVIHADAVLPGAVSVQSMKPIAGRRPQIRELFRRVKRQQLPSR